MHGWKMNKLSLVGMQLPEKYKENFDASSEGPFFKAFVKELHLHLHLQASIINVENIASFSTIISTKNMINTRTF
jgi:hypothetical protein